MTSLGKRAAACLSPRLRQSPSPAGLRASGGAPRLTLSLVSQQIPEVTGWTSRATVCSGKEPTGFEVKWNCGGGSQKEKGGAGRVPRPCALPLTSCGLRPGGTTEHCSLLAPGVGFQFLCQSLTGSSAATCDTFPKVHMVPCWQIHDSLRGKPFPVFPNSSSIVPPQ